LLRFSTLDLTTISTLPKIILKSCHIHLVLKNWLLYFIFYCINSFTKWPFFRTLNSYGSQHILYKYFLFPQKILFLIIYNIYCSYRIYIKYWIINVWAFILHMLIIYYFFVQTIPKQNILLQFFINSMWKLLRLCQDYTNATKSNQISKFYSFFFLLDFNFIRYHRPDNK